MTEIKSHLMELLSWKTPLYSGYIEGSKTRNISVFDRSDVAFVASVITDEIPFIKGSKKWLLRNHFPNLSFLDNVSISYEKRRCHSLGYVIVIMVNRKRYQFQTNPYYSDSKGMVKTVLVIN